MATAIQLPVQTGRGAKYLAKARKQQREAKAKFFDKNRAERAFEAQAMIKFETFDYLHNFIHNSEWKDLAEQITIDWDSLPPKSEVEGYGKLNKADGTRACRKLFKAAVIWDDLGCSLWENLSGYNNNNRNMIRIPEEDESSSEHEQDCYTLEAPDLARQPSISSKVSHGSAGSRRPSVDHLQDIGTALERTSSAIFKGRRRGTDPVHTPSSDKCSHIGFPRIISQNMRRTMGSFGESMIQSHGGRAL